MTQAPPLSNIPEYSVGEVSAAVRRNLEAEFPRVRVRGEISGFKRAASGHLYFNLKDDRDVLNAVCWRGVAGRLGLRPEDGMEVVATGRVTAYGARSSYQLVVDALELAGEGALLKLLEDRRRQLAEEGLFDADRKRSIPFLPERIGIVTSLGGAVLHDILHRLRERFPRHVLVWPVPVQGDGAAERIAAAMDGMGALPPELAPDVLIVARGGGSLEDLWAFNEEVVVRAAARSAIPLVSAVGHETDTTLIDFAADLRAPTPTAAAELAVPVRAELLARTAGQGERLLAAGARTVEERRAQITGLARGLPAPTALLEQASQRLDDRGERMEAGLRARVALAGAALAEISARFGQPRGLIDRQEERLAAMSAAFFRAGRQAVETHSHRLGRLDAGRRLPAAWARISESAAAGLQRTGALLESSSYRRVLERGFALVRDERGPVVSAAEARKRGKVEIVFADGGATARMVRDRTGRAPKPDQGSLL
ncbi:MAG: exodeoxyribonuclease VII large subunit [Alphaproteobacteria bacterium]|nr:exodeoxyribonuclease VII large subunit [Alphaproteobacteria bacterium]